MQGTSLAGHSILIVEYDVLIALDIQMAFEKAGASVVTVYSLPEAFPHLQQDGLSGAVLDYGLRSEDGDALCERLKQRDIPFIFHSGYGRTSDTHHGGIVIRNRPILKFWSRPLRALANQDQPSKQSATSSVLRTSRPQL
jgi:CheY-like chemotaxis protein